MSVVVAEAWVAEARAVAEGAVVARAVVVRKSIVTRPGANADTKLYTPSHRQYRISCVSLQPVHRKGLLHIREFGMAPYGVVI